MLQLKVNHVQLEHKTFSQLLVQQLLAGDNGQSPAGQTICHGRGLR
jgi:hypothetical protein